MLGGFRFLVLCREVRGCEESATDLAGVLDSFDFPRGTLPCVVELTAAVGVFVSPEIAGKVLDLRAFVVTPQGGKQKSPGEASWPVVLPDKSGPATCFFEVRLLIESAGLHGLDLWDFHKTFGPASAVVATYLFSVNEALDAERN